MYSERNISVCVYVCMLNWAVVYIVKKKEKKRKKKKRLVTHTLVVGYVCMYVGSVPLDKKPG